MEDDFLDDLDISDYPPFTSNENSPSVFKSTNNQLRNYMCRIDRRHKNRVGWISKHNLTECCYSRGLDGAPGIWFNGGLSYEAIVDVIE